MFTISGYSFHPLLSRFVTLWRCVQVVSDWFSLVLTILCCQCGALMPVEMSSTTDDKALDAEQLMEVEQLKNLVDPGKASGEPQHPQHLVIDFSPGPEDTEGVQQKCLDFWQFVDDHPELGKLIVEPERETLVKMKKENLSSKGSSNGSKSTCKSGSSRFPAIHSLKKLEDSDAIKAALDTQMSGQSCSYGLT